MLYGVAAAALPLVWLEGRFGVPFFAIAQIGFALLLVASVLSLGAVAIERRRRRAEEDVARADVMLLGAFASFVPVLGLIVAECFLRTGFPVYLALLWFIVFPISVAYGIVKKELFDIRHVMRSSAAYGAATLTITGVYAALVAAADAAMVKLHMDARSPRFTVMFMFLAILAVNPLRNRMQALVDRLFDRERGRDRQTVREISEAMVSMLSIQEIVERIVRALSDAMGVERSMVLLLADDERALRPEAWGGDFAVKVNEFSLLTEHPVCRYLWMRRQDVSRTDLAEELDPAMTAACESLFDELDVTLLVPILFGVDLLGVIAVGRKLSGERFSADDRQLLLTLANQIVDRDRERQGLRRDRQAQRDARGARRGAHARAARYPGAAHAEREDAHARPARGRRRARAEQPDRLRSRQPEAARRVRREARAAPGRGSGHDEDPRGDRASCSSAAARAPSGSPRSSPTCAPSRAWTRASSPRRISTTRSNARSR